MEPRDDPIFQGKKDVETGFRVELPKRNIPPSNTQVSDTPSPIIPRAESPKFGSESIYDFMKRP